MVKLEGVNDRVYFISLFTVHLVHRNVSFMRLLFCSKGTESHQYPVIQTGACWGKLQTEGELNIHDHSRFIIPEHGAKATCTMALVERKLPLP